MIQLCSLFELLVVVSKSLSKCFFFVYVHVFMFSAFRELELFGRCLECIHAYANCLVVSCLMDTRYYVVFIFTVAHMLGLIFA